MWILLGLLLTSSLLWCQTTAITGVTIVDGTGRQAYSGSVVMEGDRITAVGGKVELPAGARHIDGRGHTITPGFFDLHTHLPYSGVNGLSGDWPKTLMAYLHSGVTSVVDFGTYPETFEPMRRLIRDGVIVGPRLHLAARMTTPLGHGAEGGRGDFFSLEVQTPEEARVAARHLLAYQPDAIKVFTDGWRYGGGPDMSSMTLETLRAIVEEAHAKGVEVLTHTVTLEKAKIAARAGVDVIAHGIGDAVADEELIALMRSHGTTYAPTLAVYENKPRGPVVPSLRTLLEPAALEILRAARRNNAEPQPHRIARWKRLCANTAALKAAGVAFGTGTDAGVTGTYHGWSTLREMELLVACGLTPLEALTAATGNSAKALHVDQERGTIVEGKLADLVLIEGSPHTNIKDVWKVKRVFLGGKELDRAAMAGQIATAEITPLPARTVPALVDDMEGARTRLDTLRVNATDSGTDISKMSMGVRQRPEGGRALSMQATMSIKPRPFAQVVFPLSPGGVEPVDVSAYKGVRFEARGDGVYKLLVHTRAARDHRYPAALFEAPAGWKQIEIPFTSLEGTWTGRDALLLVFEMARKGGEFGWLELDNIEFY
ncbi:MAG: CIA30 family protein [Acidobacteriia bacterium]|nr:CIA30 family protein [Terriglobia bacterium]